MDYVGYGPRNFKVVVQGFSGFWPKDNQRYGRKILSEIFQRFSGLQSKDYQGSAQMIIRVQYKDYQGCGPRFLIYMIQGSSG